MIPFLSEWQCQKLQKEFFSQTRCFSEAWEMDWKLILTSDKLLSNACFQQNIKELIFPFLVIIVSPDLSLSISTESKTPGLEVFLLRNRYQSMSRHWLKMTLPDFIFRRLQFHIYIGMDLGLRYFSHIIIRLRSARFSRKV